MSCAPNGSPLPGEGEGESEGLCNATRRIGSKPLTLVLSLAHSFALTGADASVSPRTGERRERRSANLQATNSTFSPARSFVLKRKNLLLIVLERGQTDAWKNCRECSAND